MLLSIISIIIVITIIIIIAIIVIVCMIIIMVFKCKLMTASYSRIHVLPSDHDIKGNTIRSGFK